jgi:hypothetical protein
MNPNRDFPGLESEEEIKKLRDHRELHLLFGRFREKLTNEGFFKKETAAQTTIIIDTWRVRVQRAYKKVIIDKVGKKGFVTSVGASVSWYDQPECTRDDVKGFIAILLSTPMQPKFRIGNK